MFQIGTRTRFFTPDRRIKDFICPDDPEGIHSVYRGTPTGNEGYSYYCATCMWPALYAGAEDRWLVVRPHIITEEP